MEGNATEGRPALRTVLVEDDPRYRDTIETFLTHTPGFRLAASYPDARLAVRASEAAAASGESPWDLVLMDLQLPGMGGIEAIARVKAALPSAAVVVLTSFEAPGLVLQAISAGADGYLTKRVNARDLASQLKAIAAGGAPLTADVARTLLSLVRDGLPAAPASGTAAFDLTAREKDVLRCLVQGMTYGDAAKRLGVSLDTVRTHVRSMYQKLQVHSVGEAVARAVREGLA
jgi:DNA-binding NarL/FixJ family response regulator